MLKDSKYLARTRAARISGFQRPTELQNRLSRKTSTNGRARAKRHDTSDAPQAVDANAAGFLAPSDLAAAKAQVISKSGKRGWLDWRKCDWDRWGAAPRATAPCGSV